MGGPVGAIARTSRLQIKVSTVKVSVQSGSIATNLTIA